jgi:Fe-S-cluster containining protein
VIGRHLKRTPVMTRLDQEIEPEQLPAYREAQVQKYMKVPCPFLGKDKECTIYSVRPFACRSNHSLEDTPEPCDVFAGSHPVGQLNLQNFHYACAKTFLHESFGDIREYFPAQDDATQA